MSAPPISFIERDGGAVYAVHVGARQDLLALPGISESMLPQSPRKRCRAAGLGPGYFATTTIGTDRYRVKRFLQWRDIPAADVHSHAPARFTSFIDAGTHEHILFRQAEEICEELRSRGDRALLRLRLDDNGQLTGAIYCREHSGEWPCAR